MPREGAAWGVVFLIQRGEGGMAAAAEMLIVVYREVR